MSTHWKAILGVILVFVFGFSSGVVCTGIFAQHKLQAFLKHPAVALNAALEKRLTGNLSLDADQKQKIDKLFKDNLEQRKQLQKQIQPQIQMINLETYQEINAVLRPDQLERFHQNIAQFRKNAGKNALAGNEENSPATTGASESAITNSGTATPPGQ